MEGSFDFRQQLMQIYENLIESVTAAAPRVLTGILVILLAFLGARLIRWIVRSVLTRVHFDTALSKMGVDKLFQRVGIVQSPSVFISKVIYYVLLILFAQSITEAMGLSAISSAISSFLAYLPNVVAALVVMVFGSLLGQYAGGLVRRAAGESGIEFAGTLGHLLSGLILFIAAVMAVGQLKIDTDIVRIVSVCLLAGLALAFGLSFGLGSREFTRNIIAGFYAKKLFSPGDDVEVQGRRGVIQAMTTVQVLLESEDRTLAVSNSAFLDEVVKR